MVSLPLLATVELVHDVRHLRQVQLAFFAQVP